MQASKYLFQKNRYFASVYRDTCFSVFYIVSHSAPFVKKRGQRMQIPCPFCVTKQMLSAFFLTILLSSTVRYGLSGCASKITFFAKTNANLENSFTVSGEDDLLDTLGKFEVKLLQIREGMFNTSEEVKTPVNTACFSDGYLSANQTLISVFFGEPLTKVLHDVNGIVNQITVFARSHHFLLKKVTDFAHSTICSSYRSAFWVFTAN